MAVNFLNTPAYSRLSLALCSRLQPCWSCKPKKRYSLTRAVAQSSHRRRDDGDQTSIFRADEQPSTRTEFFRWINKNFHENWIPSSSHAYLEQARGSSIVSLR